jgi:hypothetical protein
MPFLSELDDWLLLSSDECTSGVKCASFGIFLIFFVVYLKRFQRQDYIASADRTMNDDLGMIWKAGAVTYSGCYPYIRFKRLRKTTDMITGIMTDIRTEHIPDKI